MRVITWTWIKVHAILGHTKSSYLEPRGIAGAKEGPRVGQRVFGGCTGPVSPAARVANTIVDKLR